MVKAMKMKKTPVARNNPKYIRDFPEGTMLVAELKFLGNPLTPLDTTSKVLVTLSLAVRTAASISNEESTSASISDLEAAA